MVAKENEGVILEAWEQEEQIRIDKALKVQFISYVVNQSLNTILHTLEFFTMEEKKDLNCNI